MGNMIEPFLKSIILSELRIWVEDGTMYSILTLFICLEWSSHCFQTCFPIGF
jgi:hypothetical protein